VNPDDIKVSARKAGQLRSSGSQHRACRTEDNNPGIENYIGRGELILSQHLGEHVIALQGRHSLRSGDESRGSIKLSWSIPINGNLKGYLTAFSGYGESLIDYNHRQTMIGAGVSLVDW
jgi:phospholipase A1